MCVFVWSQVNLCKPIGLVACVFIVGNLSGSQNEVSSVTKSLTTDAPRPDCGAIVEVGLDGTP